ncbi:SLC44A1, partial [Symbiodinium pilosum]
IARINRQDEVSVALASMDVEQLQYRASEASQTLALCAEHEGAAAQRPTEASIPCLCGLAVECINVVERAELSTGLARLVTAGCEVLSALLLPWAEASGEAWSFDWVQETLEDLSDQIDFLALEVYCGLGRLETKVHEWDALPVVLDPEEEDGLGVFWGSIEHRQALQELSSWLLCVLFRALGYTSVSGPALMEFTNHDTLCLCSLLRGLFAGRLGDGSLPHDLGELQAAALSALCGLAAPELAFYCSDGGEGDIHEQNRALNFYMEVLASAMVETGVLEASLAAALALCGRSPQEGGAIGAKFLQFLATLLVQVATQDPPAVPDEASAPLQRLRTRVYRAADKLGSLLEVVALYATDMAMQRDLAASCACLAAAMVQESGQPEGCSEDHFTLGRLGEAELPLPCCQRLRRGKPGSDRGIRETCHPGGARQPRLQRRGPELRDSDAHRADRPDVPRGCCSRTTAPIASGSTSTGVDSIGRFSAGTLR